MDATRWTYERLSRDGAPYKVRPIRKEDEQRELQFVRSLSAETLYDRVMYRRKPPGAAELRQLVTVDYNQTMAFVATVDSEAGEQFIAVARYACDPPTTGTRRPAEFAVTVTDAWQNRGVGSEITRILFDYAAQHDVARVYGTVLAGNQRMIRLLHFLGLRTAPAPDDARLVLAQIDLQPMGSASG